MDRARNVHLDNRVDVIIPLYNGGRWIRQTLDAVFQQTVRPRRVIIVDDGSTDGSLEQIDPRPEIVVLKNPLQGPDEARNFGLQNSEAEFVAYLDQDDLWHPQHLELLINALDQEPLAGAAMAGMVMIKEGRKAVYDMADAGYDYTDPWENFPSVYVPHVTSAVVYRRSCLDCIGGWVPQFNGYGDYHIWFRAALHFPVLQLRSKTFGYRLHADSQMRNLEKNMVPVMKLWIAGAEDLLNRYTAKYGAKQSLSLRRRCLIYQNLHSVMESLMNDRTDDLPNALLSTDMSLRGDSKEFYRHVREDIVYILTNSSATLPEFEERVNKLIQLCPVSAKIMREVLIRTIFPHGTPLRPYWNYFWTRPRELERLTLFLGAARRKFVARSFQISDDKSPFVCYFIMSLAC